MARHTPRVHLYLRSVTTGNTNPRYWVITWPDRVTFYFNSDQIGSPMASRRSATAAAILGAAAGALWWWGWLRPLWVLFPLLAVRNLELALVGLLVILPGQGARAPLLEPQTHRLRLAASDAGRGRRRDCARCRSRPFP